MAKIITSLKISEKEDRELQLQYAKEQHKNEVYKMSETVVGIHEVAIQTIAFKREDWNKMVLDLSFLIPQEKKRRFMEILNKY